MGQGIAPGGAPLPETGDLADAPALALLVILALICVWDAGLFLAGIVLARLILRTDPAKRFDWRALAIMQLWGQAQSFAIEIYAIERGYWAYRPTPGNPELFPWAEASITLWPQLVWFLATFIFYAAALWLNRRRSAPASQSGA